MDEGVGKGPPVAQAVLKGSGQGPEASLMCPGPWVGLLTLPGGPRRLLLRTESVNGPHKSQDSEGSGYRQSALRYLQTLICDSVLLCQCIKYVLMNTLNSKTQRLPPALGM